MRDSDVLRPGAERSAALALRSIEATRSRLLAWAADFDAREAGRRPGPDRWSILEILEHLVLAEEDVLGDPSKISDRPTLRRSLRSRGLYALVMFILRWDIPVRVPSRGMKPGGEVDIAGLRSRWEANHTDLRRWVDEAGGARLRRPLFTHPVSGPMSTPQALRMLRVHLERHVRQIRGLAPPTGAHLATELEHLAERVWLGATLRGFAAGFVFMVALLGLGETLGGGYEFPIGVGAGAGLGLMQGRAVAGAMGGGRRWMVSSVVGFGLPFLFVDVARFSPHAMPWMVPFPLLLAAAGGVAAALRARAVADRIPRAWAWAAASTAGWVVVGAAVPIADRVSRMVAGPEGALVFLGILASAVCVTAATEAWAWRGSAAALRRSVA